MPAMERSSKLSRNGAEFLGRALVQTDVGLRLEDGAPVVDDVQEEVGQFIRHVLAALAHAGKGEQLTETCGDALVAADFDHGVIGGVGMEPHAAEDVLHEVFGHALFDGLFVVRIEVLVDAAEGNAGSRIVLIRHDQHVGHPQGLDGFPEVGGRQFFRHGAAGHHGAQLCAVLAVLFCFRETVVHRLIAFIFRLEAVIDDLLVVRDEVSGRSARVAVTVLEQERHALAGFLDELVTVLLLLLRETHGGHDVEAGAAEEVSGDDLHRDLVHDAFLEEVCLPLHEGLVPEPVRHLDHLRELLERAGERRQERVVLRDDVVRHLVELTVPGSAGRVTGVLVVPFAIDAFEVIVSQPFRPRTELAWLFDRVFILDRH